MYLLFVVILATSAVIDATHVKGVQLDDVKGGVKGGVKGLQSPSKFHPKFNARPVVQTQQQELKGIKAVKQEPLPVKGVKTVQQEQVMDVQVPQVRDVQVPQIPQVEVKQVPQVKTYQAPQTQEVLPQQRQSRDVYGKTNVKSGVKGVQSDVKGLKAPVKGAQAPVEVKSPKVVKGMAYPSQTKIQSPSKVAQQMMDAQQEQQRDGLQMHQQQNFN